MKNKLLIAIACIFFTAVAAAQPAVPIIQQFTYVRGIDTVRAEFQLEVQGSVPITVHGYVTEDANPGVHIQEQNFELPEFIWGWWMTVRGLKPLTDYTFHFWATNSEGSSTIWEIPFQTEPQLASGISQTDLDAVKITTPSQGRITITLPQSLENQRLVITNLLGQPVHSMQSTAMQSIDVSDVPHGMYLVSIGDDANRVTRKVMW